MFKEKWSCCGPGAAEWTRLVIDRWHYRQFGEVSNRMSSSLAARWLPLSKHFWASAEQGGGVRGGVETAHWWKLREPMCICLSQQVIGTGKWAGRTPEGSSPRVHGNGPSSAANQSSRGVQWHHRAGSVAGWGGVEWSRRERGHDGDAVEGWRKRERREEEEKKRRDLIINGVHNYLIDSLSQWNTARHEYVNQTTWLLTGRLLGTFAH